MSGFVANLKYCRKCKRYYDANTTLNRLGCPYCRQKAIIKFIEKGGNDTNHNNLLHTSSITSSLILAQEPHETIQQCLSTP
jgi:DNA-directed RNA polymerase subunit RPC12/RpoP